jgi:hypothetical protein
MASFLNNDDNIWLKHISADPKTMAMLQQIPAGSKLNLEIEGVMGEWARTNNGRDGRPTYALKPVGKTIAYWKTMKARRGEYLELKVLDKLDPYLDNLEAYLSEWNSAEDELAFRDL